MHIIQNYTMKKNIVKKILPLVMALLQRIKNLFGPLLMTWTADSPTRRYGESATPRLTDAGSRGVYKRKNESLRSLCLPVVAGISGPAKKNFKRCRLHRLRILSAVGYNARKSLAL